MARSKLLTAQTGVAGAPTPKERSVASIMGKYSRGIRPCAMEERHGKKSDVSWVKAIAENFSEMVHARIDAGSAPSGGT
jgi:hypothetical protein